MASYNLIWKTNLTQYASQEEVKALVRTRCETSAFFFGPMAGVERGFKITRS